MPAQQLLTAANTLNLEKEKALLEALGKAADELANLQVHIAGLGDLEDLLNKINSTADGPAVKTAFHQLGLDALYADLTGFLGKIVKLDEKIPDAVKGLLNTLRFLRAHPDLAHIDWSIATPSKPAIKTDRYTLDLGASAGLTLDANAKWPDDAASPPLLRMGAHGELKASATATIPYAFGPIKAGAGVSAKPALDYYFSPAGDPILAAAVGARLAALPDPFDFASVWEAFQDQALALEGVAYAFDGGANASLQVAMTNPLPLALGVTAELGAKVSVSASLNSKYVLRLRRAGAGIRATLSRDKVSEETLGLELKLEVDLSTVTKPALDALDGLAAQWDQALAVIRPYLSPGTLLRDTVVAGLSKDIAVLVHDDELRKAILADAKGALGVGAVDEPQIVQWLEAKITGAIDQGSVLVDGQLSKAVDQVMGKLAKSLPILAANDPSGQLKALVAKQVATLETLLTDAVAELFKTPAGEVKAALAKAGAAVSGAVASVDALLKPVRDLLKKYDDKLHEILDKVEAAAKQKATARFYADETLRDETIVEIDGDFTAATPEAAKVFEGLTRGALEPLVRIVDGAQPNGFTLRADGSSITRFSEFKGDQGLEVVFLGVTLSYQEFVDGKAKVKLDGRGDIHVDTEARLKKTLSLFSDREVSFTDAHALVLTKAMRANGTFGKPTLAVGVGASYSEKWLELDDVQDFMGGLAGANLIRGDAPTHAEAMFEAWEKASANGKVKADIAADLTLTAAQAEHLMQLGQRDANGLLPAARLEVIRVGLHWLKTFKALDSKQFDQGCAYARSRCINHPNPPVAEEDVVLRHRQFIPPMELDNTASALGQQEVFEYFLDRADGLLKLVDLVDTMGAIYTAPPVVAGAGWDADKYRAAQTAMANDSKAQLTVAKDVLGLFTAKITPRTLAFMRTIADLAGPDDANVAAGARVTLTNRPATGDPQTAAFV